MFIAASAIWSDLWLKKRQGIHSRWDEIREDRVFASGHSLVDAPLIVLIYEIIAGIKRAELRGGNLRG